MRGVAARLLEEVDAAPAASAAAFRAFPVPDRERYLIGRTPSATPCLMVAAPGLGRTVPLRLANIEATFAVPCSVSEPGGPTRNQTLSVVSCTSTDPAVQAYFIGLLDLLMDLLGPTPILSAVVEVVESLVTLFEKLRRPARSSISGLAGELFVIAAARNPAAAVFAWRLDPDERFDFSLGSLRLEAKATGGGRRIHSMSFEQANPPADTVGLLASVVIEPAGGGTSMGEMVAELEGFLHDHAAIMRLRSVMADTLGEALPTALAWRFDLERARESLAFFDLRSVPAIRPPIPSEVSGVRFMTDLSSQPMIGDPAALAPAEAAILPR